MILSLYFSLSLSLSLDIYFGIIPFLLISHSLVELWNLVWFVYLVLFYPVGCFVTWFVCFVIFLFGFVLV